MLSSDKCNLYFGATNLSFKKVFLSLSKFSFLDEKSLPRVEMSWLLYLQLRDPPGYFKCFCRKQH